jgi:hypothetical protein
LATNPPQSWTNPFVMTPNMILGPLKAMSQRIGTNNPRSYLKRQVEISQNLTRRQWVCSTYRSLI